MRSDGDRAAVAGGRCKGAAGNVGLGRWRPRSGPYGRNGGRRALLALALMAGLGVVLVGCSSGESGAATDAASPQADATVADASPTQPAAPAATPTPEPTVEPTAAPPTPEPTATPTPTTEAEVIAAWERYLRLSIEARGQNPSPEALDFDSYVIGGARDGLVQVIADYAASGRFVRGSMLSTAADARIRDDGAAVVSDCADVNLSAVSAASGGVLEVDVQRAGVRARLERVGDSWVVAAFEFGVGECTG